MNNTTQKAAPDLEITKAATAQGEALNNEDIISRDLDFLKQYHVSFKESEDHPHGIPPFLLQLWEESKTSEQFVQSIKKIFLLDRLPEIKLHYMELPENIYGCCTQPNNDKCLIFINSLYDGEQLSTYLHELCHILYEDFNGIGEQHE